MTAPADLEIALRRTPDAADLIEAGSRRKTI